MIILSKLAQRPIIRLGRKLVRNGNNITKMRAALYSRVSTDKQADKYGIPSQIEALRERCLERGWTMVLDGDKDTFIDDGYSGAELERQLAGRLLAQNNEDQIRSLMEKISLELDNLDFMDKQELLRLLVEKVFYSGQNVEILTIIPLGEQLHLIHRGGLRG